MSITRTARNYLIRFGLAAIVYTVTLFFALPAARTMAEGPARYVLACLPVSGIGLGAWALWTLIQEVDEMQSRKLQDSLAFSLTLTMLISSAIGLMQSVGLPELSWTWVIFLWGVSFGIGTMITAWRYR